MILRSLITEPDLLILDEPCASLDLFQREQILDTLTRIEKTNLIYITHDIMEILPEFSHLMLLKDGKILAQGKKQNILTEENLRQLYGLNIELLDLADRPMIKINN